MEPGHIDFKYWGTSYSRSIIGNGIEMSSWHIKRCSILSLQIADLKQNNIFNLLADIKKSLRLREYKLKYLSRKAIW